MTEQSYILILQDRHSSIFFLVSEYFLKLETIEVSDLVMYTLLWRLVRLRLYESVYL